MDTNTTDTADDAGGSMTSRKDRRTGTCCQALDKESLTYIKVMRWVSFVVACLAVLMCGEVLAFNSHINDVKHIFNITQTDVELIGSLLRFGASMGLPHGIFLEKVGLKPAFTISLLLCLVSSCLIASATWQRDFYHSRLWLLCIYFFTLGFGMGLLFFAALLTSMKNYTKVYLGKVVATIGTFSWVGPALISLVYGTIFKPHEDVGGFYLTLASSLVLVNILGTLFIRDYPPRGNSERNQEEQSEIPSISTKCCAGEVDPEMINLVAEEIPSQTVDVTGIKLLCSLDFYLLAVSFIFSVTVQANFFSNVAVFLLSFGWADLAVTLTVTGPIIAVVSQLLSGVASDCLLPRVPRSAFIAVSSTLTTILQGLCIYFSDKKVLFIINFVSVYTFNGLVFVIYPTLFAEHFGMKYFGRNWGSVVILMSLSYWLFSYTMGCLYDEQLDPDDPMATCFGKHCFTLWFVITTILSGISSVMTNILLIQGRRPPH